MHCSLMEAPVARFIQWRLVGAVIFIVVAIVMGDFRVLSCCRLLFQSCFKALTLSLVQTYGRSNGSSMVAHLLGTKPSCDLPSERWQILPLTAAELEPSRKRTLSVRSMETVVVWARFSVWKSSSRHQERQLLSVESS